MPGDQRKVSQEPAMTLLIVGVILFFGVHSVRIFADSWRSAQIARMGDRRFRGIAEARSSRRDSVSPRYGWKGCGCGGDRCGGLGAVRVLVARMVDRGEAAGIVPRRNGVQETLEVIGKPLTPSCKY